MSSAAPVSPDEIRTRFSRAMSEVYRQEVPQYGVLLNLVAAVNGRTLEAHPGLRARLSRCGELQRLQVERHGAIRLGTRAELADMRRVFAVMGMMPVGYYDLSVAGVPVHSTAFRPVTDAALAVNPFRVFTSLLRLELIEDVGLRKEAARILSRRRIFTERALELTQKFERAGELTDAEADEFVAQVLETFRWHHEAAVDAETYRKLHDAHRLVADVVSFKGPHINHLTPRTLDIDAAQAEMPKWNIVPKELIEGPPKRRIPILLRQTSFKALEERVTFPGSGTRHPGTHTARFGEIEQRGAALTRAGRELYDRLLARRQAQQAAGTREERSADALDGFPDDLETLRREKLAFFHYTLAQQGTVAADRLAAMSLEALIASGCVHAEPIVYEDFLPVSAAGIFQSNLGGTEPRSYSANAAKDAFEAALGAKVLDEFELYGARERASLALLDGQLRRA
ncbi:MAG: VOC family protein [Steroidobacteraceae bacterium]